VSLPWTRRARRLGGSSIIRSDRAVGGANVGITISSIIRNLGATVHFIGGNTDLGTTGNTINVTGGANPFVNGVLPWATVEGPAGYDLVRDVDGTAGGAYTIGRVTAYSADINLGGIVKISGGSSTLNANRTVDALLLVNGATVGGAFNLQVGTSVAGLLANIGGGTISSNVTFGGAEALVLVEAGSTLTLSGSVAGPSFRKERNGRLVLSGSNTGLAGVVTVADGTLQVTKATGLGSAFSGTAVNAMASLEIDAASGPFNFGTESFTINGTGENNNLMGALKVVNGNVTIGTGTTLFTEGSETSISVESGRTLILNATIATNTFTKLGGGTLELGGAASNTGTGAITVAEGTLRLNKSGAFNAVTGALTIGRSAGSASVVYASTAGTDQILHTGAANAVNTVTITHGGVLDLAGRSDIIGDLVMTGGTVETGAGASHLGGQRHCDRQHFLQHSGQRGGDQRQFGSGRRDQDHYGWRRAGTE